MPYAFQPNVVFVFGSNLRGSHGAAYDALTNYGAIMGQPSGRQGSSYAIPTMDRQLRSLHLSTIKLYVETFLFYASRHPTEQFYVTRIGCGIAGYTDDDIAPMFKDAPTNCQLPDNW